MHETVLLMAWRNIWRQKRRSILVMSAAMTGMTGIILTFGMINGMRNMMQNGAIESGLAHIQIHPNGYKDSRADSMQLNTQFISDPGFKKVIEKYRAHTSLRYERDGILRMGSHIRGVRLIGIDPDSEKATSHFDEWMDSGSWFPALSKQDTNYAMIPCMIGRENAKFFEVEPGDSLIISLSNKAAENTSVRCRITGTFKSIAEPVDKYTVLLLRSDISRQVGLTENTANYLAILTESIKVVDTAADEIQKTLAKHPVDVLTFGDLQPGIHRMLEISDNTIYIFYAILMTGFGLILMNAVLMSVFERSREFGILKALGTSGGRILNLILSESVILSLAGCIAGIVVGSLFIIWLQHTGLSLSMFAKGMEKMGGSGTVLYPSIRLQDLLGGLSVALVISLLSALYPAIKAVKIIPVKAIYGR